jgi:hypothetical protein
MLRRSKVIETVSSLPTTFTMEELIDRLIVLKKIEVGLEQANKGQTISQKEAKSKLKKWLK